MGDNNLYPPHNPKTRRRGRRAARPAHLPAYVPVDADGARPEHESVAKKQLAVAPAAPAFGAKKGANNALLFHQLKTTRDVDSADNEE
jgi:hypothetical protein